MRSKDCQHPRRISDNYGTSCMDCGEQIRGYGYWGHFPNCIHLLLKSEDGTYAICMFCEREFELGALEQGRKEK